MTTAPALLAAPEGLAGLLRSGRARAGRCISSIGI